MAKSIYSWFRSKRNLKLLERLAKVNIKIQCPKRTPQAMQQRRQAKLRAKTFVLTGELEDLSREQAKEKIRELGGDISGSVSKNTDWVVIGKEPGLKYDKAKKLGVKILNERQFLKMIK